MRLRIGNSYSQLIESSPRETAWLRAKLEHLLGSYDRLGPEGPEVPTGLVPIIGRMAEEDEISWDVVDARKKPCERDPNADLAWLRPHQREALEDALKAERGVVCALTACHPAGQLVVMLDGTLRPVEQLVVGDALLGPDSRPRRVAALHRGRARMYEISPARSASFRVTIDHVLTLTRTNVVKNDPLGGEVIDVSLREWLTWKPGKRHLYKLFSAPAVEFRSRTRRAALPLDPYFLGLLLGDGRLTQCVGVTKPDPEVRAACVAVARQFGLKVYRDQSAGKSCPTWLLIKRTRRGRPLANPLISVLRDLGLWGCTAGTKFVPGAYLRASRRDRQSMLAGLLDADGHLSTIGRCHTYDFISKSPQLSEAVTFLARSLGLFATLRPCQKWSQNGAGGTYYRVTISGNLVGLPLRIPRKRARLTHPRPWSLRRGFRVRDTGAVASYYGFTLTGDGRYLLDDFTVTHNSGKTEVLVAAPRVVPCHWLLLSHSTSVVEQAAARFERRNREHGLDLGPAGVIGGGRWSIGARLTCATYQSLFNGAKGLSKRGRAVLLLSEALQCDECHSAAAPEYYEVAMAATNAYYRIGYSMTPLDRGDDRNAYVVAALGPIIYQKPSTVFFEAGLVATPEVEMLYYDHLIGKGGDKTYETVVVRGQKRNEALLREIVKAERPVLVFVRAIVHGGLLRQALRAAGLRAEFVWGQRSVEFRKEVYRMLNEGGLDVGICNIVGEQGVDVPALRSVFIGGAGGSVIGSLQRPGRGMRLAPGKTTFKVYDFVDRGVKALMRQARRRRAAYDRENFAVSERILGDDNG